MKLNKLHLLFIAILSFNTMALPQSYNSERVTLSNYLIRMYEQTPFEGVKVVEGYYDQYLISVVVLSIIENEDVFSMDRVAEIEARSQANRFFNSSKISVEKDVIRMSEIADEKKTRKAITVVNEKSFGYIKALELLSKNEIDNKMVYFYSTKIK